MIDHFEEVLDSVAKRAGNLANWDSLKIHEGWFDNLLIKLNTWSMKDIKIRMAMLTNLRCVTVTANTTADNVNLENIGLITKNMPLFVDVMVFNPAHDWELFSFEEGCEEFERRVRKKFPNVSGIDLLIRRTTAAYGHEHNLKCLISERNGAVLKKPTPLIIFVIAYS